MSTSFTRSHVLVIFVAALAGLLAACTGSGSGDGNVEPGPDEGDGDATLQEVPRLAAASSDFVSAAIEGQRAASYFAVAAGTDVDARTTPDSAVLDSRLTDLEAFRGSVDEVRIATDAYPGGAADLAPSCGQSAGVYCQVDLVSAGGSVIASVVVYWFGDGVTDFSIMPRSGEGLANGIGEARCDAGFSLLHGGHTDRFDVVICIDDSGAFHYTGAERGKDLGIRLDACQDGPDRWSADNNGFQYVIERSDSDVGSDLEVSNPAGDLIANGEFTTVHLERQATPVFC